MRFFFQMRLKSLVMDSGTRNELEKCVERNSRENVFIFFKYFLKFHSTGTSKNHQIWNSEFPNMARILKKNMEKNTRSSCTQPIIHYPHGTYFQNPRFWLHPYLGTTSHATARPPVVRRAYDI